MSTTRMKSVEIEPWERTINGNILCLRVSGLWPEPFYTWDLYTLYSITITLSQVVFLGLEFIELYISFYDFYVVLEICMYLVCTSFSLIKGATVVLNLTEIRSIMGGLNTVLHREKDLYGGYIQRKQQLVQQLWHFLFGGSFTTVVVWVLVPILVGTYKTLVLPMPIYCPFDCSALFNYIAAYAFVAINTIVLIIRYFNVDIFIFGLFISVEVQCELLARHLQGLNEAPVVFQRKLVEYVSYHQSILSSVYKINRMCNVMFLSQFMFGSFLIALMLFQTTLYPADNLTYYSRLSAATVITMQMLVYCWFGDTLHLKGQLISRSLFESSWVAQSTAVKKLLLVFLSNTQVPIKLSAFKMFFLSLEVFIKIIKSAWSFMVILKQLVLKS